MPDSPVFLGANAAWYDLIRDLIQNGQENTVRGLKTKEILGKSTYINMNYPIVQNKSRYLGLKFMAAEAHWILTGQNKVESIAPYSKEISNFSDDGIFYHGAYGPKIIDQLPHVIRTLEKDPYSRQAVINIWRETPPETKDVPCTLSAQWLVRDNRLYCIDTMRSSDIWLGWPYDVFNFSMLSLYILLLLRSRPILNIDWGSVRLGGLILTAGSQHYYERHYQQVENVLKEQQPFTSIGQPAMVQDKGFDDPNRLLHELACLKDWSRSDLFPGRAMLGEFCDVFKIRYGTK